MERPRPAPESLRDSFAWAAAEGDVDTVGRLGLGLGHFLHRRGYVTEAREIVEAALVAHAQSLFREPGLREELLALRASVLLDCGVVEQAEHDARELLRLAGSPSGRARAANLLGLAAHARGNLWETRAQLHAALASARAAGDLAREGMALNNLGMVEDEDPEGSSESASEHYDQALRLFRETGYERGAAEVLTNLGAHHYVECDLPAAYQSYGEALRLALEQKHVLGLGRVLFNLAEMAQAQPEWGDARRLCLAAEHCFARAGSPYRAVATELLVRLSAGTPDKASPPEGLWELSLVRLVQWAGADDAGGVPTPLRAFDEA